MCSVLSLLNDDLLEGRVVLTLVLICNFLEEKVRQATGIPDARFKFTHGKEQNLEIFLNCSLCK